MQKIYIRGISFTDSVALGVYKNIKKTLNQLLGFLCISQFKFKLFKVTKNNSRQLFFLKKNHALQINKIAK